MDLDTRNPNLSPDWNDPTKNVHLRIAGVGLEVDLEYSNTNEEGQPDPLQVILGKAPQMRAVISIKANNRTWAGPGPSITWPQYPSGPSKSQTYHKVTRYRQGVVVKFVSLSSKIYEFDVMYLVTALCNAIVILTFANMGTQPHPHPHLHPSPRNRARPPSLSAHHRPADAPRSVLLRLSLIHI